MLVHQSAEVQCRIPVEHGETHPFNGTNSESLQFLKAQQLLPNNVSENNSSSEHNYLNLQTTDKLKSNTVVLAPIEIDTDPMLSLAALNRQSQITRL